MADKTKKLSINVGIPNINRFNGQYTFQLIIFFFSVFIYSASFFNGYNLDDELVTVNHKLTSQGLKAISEIFTSPYYSDDMGYAYDYRPLVHLSFAFEHQFLGEHAAVSHGINVFLYALCCVLLFVVLKKLPNLSAPFAFCVALLFCAFPTHTENVCSIKNRDEILALIFSLLSFLLAQSFIIKKQALRLIPLFVLYICSLLSKYSAVNFAIIIPIALVLFYRISWKKLFFVCLTFLIPTFLLNQDVSVINRIYFVTALFAAPFAFYIIQLPFKKWGLYLYNAIAAIGKKLLEHITWLITCVFAFFKKALKAILNVLSIFFRKALSVFLWLTKKTTNAVFQFIVFWVSPYLKKPGTEISPATKVELKNLFRFRFTARAMVYLVLTVASIYYPHLWFVGLVAVLFAFLYHKTADREEKIWIWLALSIPLMYYNSMALIVHKQVDFLSPILFLLIFLVLNRSAYSRVFTAISLLLTVLILLANGDLGYLVPLAAIVVSAKKPDLSKLLAGVVSFILLAIGLAQLRAHWIQFGALYHEPVNESIHLLSQLFLMFVIFKKTALPKTITVLLLFALMHFVTAQYVLNGYIKIPVIPIKSVHIKMPEKVRPVVLPVYPKPQKTKISWPKLPALRYALPPPALPAKQEPEPVAFELLKVKSNRQLDFVESPVTRFDKMETRVASAFAVGLFYFKSLVAPYPLGFYYGYSEFKPESFTSAKFIISLLIHLTLLVLLLWSYKKNELLLVFALTIYFVSVFSLSGFLQRIAGVAADRFVIIPSLAYCIVIVWLIYTLFKATVSTNKSLKQLPLFAKCAVSILLLFYTGITVARNFNWKDDLTLMQHDIRFLENSAQAHSLLAVHLMQRADFEQQPTERIKLINNALTHFKTALNIYPSFYNAAYNLGKVYTQLANNDSAALAYKRALSIDNSDTGLYLIVGDLLLASGKKAEAIPFFKTVILNTPYEYTGYNKLSYTYFLLADYTASINVNKLAARKMPAIPDPLINIGVAFQQMQAPDSAALYLRQALTIDPANKEAQSLLAKTANH